MPVVADDDDEALVAAAGEGDEHGGRDTSTSGSHSGVGYVDSLAPALDSGGDLHTTHHQQDQTHDDPPRRTVHYPLGQRRDGPPKEKHCQSPVAPPHPPVHASQSTRRPPIPKGHDLIMLPAGIGSQQG